MHKRGFFLISSYLVLALLGTLSLSLFLKNASTFWTSERNRNRIAAFQLAEAGLDQAIATLRTNSTYTGQGYTALSTAGGFDVAVETPDRVGNPTVRRITATGHTPGANSTAFAYERRQVVAYVDFPPPVSGNFAVFSDTSIQMSGNVVLDSYDSRRGSYQSQAARSNGHLGTNTTRAGFVMMSGNVRIRGDAVVGPLGDPSRVITTSGNAVIEGSRRAATALRVLDPVVVPSGLVGGGNLRLNGNDVLTLGGGTYLYSSINVSGNARVNFTGPATVYVTGNVSISGNGVGTSQNLPPNLKIMVAGQRSISYSGNANFYGVLYAPDSNVSITANGELSGSVTGDSLQQSGNGKVHYDEALSASTGGTVSTTSRLMAWTES